MRGCSSLETSTNNSCRYSMEAASSLSFWWHFARRLPRPFQRLTPQNRAACSARLDRAAQHLGEEPTRLDVAPCEIGQMVDALLHLKPQRLDRGLR